MRIGYRSLGCGLLGLIALAVAMVQPANAQAPCSAFSTPLVPGSSVLPGSCTGAPPGTLLATISTVFPVGTNATAAFVSAVYLEPGGTLDFLYQIQNQPVCLATPCVPIIRLAGTIFTGFSTAVATRTDAVGPFLAGPVLPSSADRNSAGDTVGFNFSGVAPGTNSAVLVVVTNATHFNTGQATVTATNGAQGIEPSLEPIGTPVAGPTTAATNFFQLRYATHIQSGFDGDVINITNDGSSSPLAPGGAGSATTSSGNLCIGVYFFDPNEELQACCACEVTPNGLISLSVKANNANNLTSEFPDSEVVKLLAWSATSTATATGSIFGPGSPIQATPGASICNAAAPGPLASGLQAWGTSLHTVPSGFAMTETPFSKGSLSAFEYSRLSSFCSYNQFAGSGNYGQCKGCQSGGLGAAASQ